MNRDKGATAQISGNGTFGQVAASFSTRLAMDKAREYGIGMVSMYDIGHTGRIGTYPEMAARHGMAAIMFNGGLQRGSVAPFGGREGRLSTNPVSLSFPASDGRVVPLYVLPAGPEQLAGRRRDALVRRDPARRHLTSHGLVSPIPLQ